MEKKIEDKEAILPCVGSIESDPNRRAQTYRTIGRSKLRAVGVGRHSASPVFLMVTVPNDSFPAAPRCSPATLSDCGALSMSQLPETRDICRGPGRWKEWCRVVWGPIHLTGRRIMRSTTHSSLVPPRLSHAFTRLLVSYSRRLPHGACSHHRSARSMCCATCKAYFTVTSQPPTPVQHAPGTPLPPLSPLSLGTFHSLGCFSPPLSLTSFLPLLRSCNPYPRSAPPLFATCMRACVA